MDSTEWAQQCLAHQWTGCSPSFLHSHTARVAHSQHQLWRGLCPGAHDKPTLPHRTHLRRGVPVPQMGRQQRCCAKPGENQQKQYVQGPPAYAGDSGTTAGQPAMAACAVSPRGGHLLPVRTAGMARGCGTLSGSPATSADTHIGCRVRRGAAGSMESCPYCQHRSTGGQQVSGSETMFPLRQEPSSSAA